jgi:hypothetical protein
MKYQIVIAENAEEEFEKLKACGVKFLFQIEVCFLNIRSGEVGSKSHKLSLISAFYCLKNKTFHGLKNHLFLIQMGRVPAMVKH